MGWRCWRRTRAGRISSGRPRRISCTYSDIDRIPERAVKTDPSTAGIAGWMRSRFYAGRIAEIQGCERGGAGRSATREQCPSTRGEAVSRDVQEVLAEKFRELRECQQQVACLKIVLPLLVEEGDTPLSLAKKAAQEILPTRKPK